MLISGYRSSAQKEATLARSGHTLVVGDGDGVETGEGPGQGVGPPLVCVHIPRSPGVRILLLLLYDAQGISFSTIS